MTDKEFEQLILEMDQYGLDLDDVLAAYQALRLIRSGSAREHVLDMIGRLCAEQELRAFLDSL